ncbi:MAG: hypothetical protein AB7K24_33435, partial [Gemmataceae bacterium]
MATMKTAFVVAAVFAAVLAAGVASTPAVSACSLAPLERRYLPDLVERTPIIAIGTWADTGEYEATLVVDESLKGTEAGARYLFDNRGTYTMAACSPYEEEFHSGFRFEDGQRSVVFMEKQVDGLWQIGWSGYAAFDLPVDDFAPMPMWQVENPPTLLETVRTVVSAAPALDEDDREALEVELGCNPPFLFNPQKITEYRGLATGGVAIVTVVDSPPLTGEPSADPVIARIDQVLAGELNAGTSITLNDRWISDYETQECQPSLEDGRRGLAQGIQYLVFLRDDEYEIGAFRPVAWGRGVVEINEKYITGGQITLADVRALTGTERTEPAATGATPAGEQTADLGTGLMRTEGDSGGPGL